MMSENLCRVFHASPKITKVGHNDDLLLRFVREWNSRLASLFEWNELRCGSLSRSKIRNQFSFPRTFQLGFSLIAYHRDQEDLQQFPPKAYSLSGRLQCITFRVRACEDSPIEVFQVSFWFLCLHYPTIFYLGAGRPLCKSKALQW